MIAFTFGWRHRYKWDREEEHRFFRDTHFHTGRNDNTGLKELKYKLFSSRKGFGANIRNLMTGTTLAQAVNMAVAPVLTRIYAPEDYGILALFISTGMVLSLMASLSYEAGVMLPEDNNEAWTLLVLSLILSSGFCATLFIIMIPGAQAVSGFMGVPEFSPYLIWVPFVAFLFAVNRGLEMWLSRRVRFSLLAGAKIAGSATGAGTKLWYGLTFHPTAVGLVWGTIVCEVGKILCAVVGKGLSGNTSFLFRSCKTLMVRYGNFPRYQTGASLLEFMGNAVPVFVIARLFGTTTVGLYDLGFRMVFIPVELVIQSLRQVFYQKSVEDLRKDGTIAKLVEKTGSKLFLFGIVPFFLLGTCGSFLFSFVFGPEWSRAGLYAQMLSPAFFLRCVALPILIFNTFNRQNIYLKWQIMHFSLHCTALGVGGIADDDILTIALLSAVSCCTHMVLLYWNCKAASASLKRTLLGCFIKG